MSRNVNYEPTPRNELMLLLVALGPAPTVTVVAVQYAGA